MHRRLAELHPWVWASASAVIATVALTGTIAEVIRRHASTITALDPRASYDPYYGLAEYTLNLDPAPQP